MRVTALVGPVLLALGAVCVGIAVASGGAHAALFLVFPVFYGDSLLFLGGIALLVLGLLALPFAFPADGPADDGPAAPGGVSSGGLVLIGPIPIFWGSASGASRKVRIAAAVAGGAALVLAAAVFVALYR